MPCWRSSLSTCLPWEGPHTATGEKHGEEGVAEIKHYELTAILIPHPLVLLRAGGGRKVRSEVDPEKKGEVGGRCF